MRKSTRPIVENIEFLDISSLSKFGAFEGGELSYPYAAMRYPFLARLRTNRFRVDLWPRRATRWVSFPVEWTRCTFGGLRPWFKCHCGVRVAKLYYAGIFVGCRHCYKMDYECQRRGERSRGYYQACKIRLSLGGAPTIAEPFPERPRRMWRGTYERLRCEAEELEAPLRRSRFMKREPDYERFSFF
jgi:hypothetical protein